jgi:hypothetical protein
MTEVFVLNLNSGFDQSVHFFGHEIESFNHWDQYEELFLKFDFLFFNQSSFQLINFPFSFANTQISLVDNVLIVANQQIRLKLLLNIHVPVF